MNLGLPPQEEGLAQIVAQNELVERYFEALEADQVEFLEYETSVKGGTTTHVKDEYAQATDKEMIEYIERQNA